MLLSSGRLFCIAVSRLHAHRPPLRLESRVDVLVLLVHVGSKMSSRLRRVESERPRFSGLLRFLELLHFRDEVLLELPEVGDGASASRLEGELHARQIIGRVLRRIEVLFNAALALIFMFLHARRQLGLLQ